MATTHTQTKLKGTTGTDIHDVTPLVAQAVDQSNIASGMVTIHTPGSTAAVTTIEYESGCLNDLQRLLEELAPAGGQYEHNLRWQDGNGYSHLRAALMGPSLTLPVMEAKAVLGTWQQVIVLDFDNKARERRLIVTVVGD